MRYDDLEENPSRYSPLTAPRHVRVRWGKKSWQTRQRRAISDLMECQRQLKSSGRRYRRPAAPYRVAAKRRRYSRPASSRRSHHRHYGSYRHGLTEHGPYGPSSRFYKQDFDVPADPYEYFRGGESPVEIAQKILRPDFTPQKTIGGEGPMTAANNPELLVVHNPYGRRRRKYVSGSKFSLRHRRGAKNMRRKARNMPLTVKVGRKRLTAKKFFGAMRKRGLSTRGAWSAWKRLPKYHGHSGGSLAAGGVGGRRRRRKGKRKYSHRAKRRYGARAKRRYSRHRKSGGRKSSRRARAARKGWRTRRAKRAARKYSRRRRKYSARAKRRYSRRRRARGRRKIYAGVKRRYRRFSKLSEAAKMSAYGMNPRRRRRRRR